MRDYEVQGVVLRSVDYRDSDRILTLYAREHGRISAIARGARASRRRFLGSLEPFTLTRFELRHGRQLETLRRATVVRAFPAILAALKRIDFAGRASGLVREVTMEGEGDVRLFDALIEFFAALGEGPDDEALLYAFQIRALVLCGLQPLVRECSVSGTQRPAGQPAYFDGARGGIVRRELLGGARAGVLAMSGAALDRIAASFGDDWRPMEAWSEQERDAVRRCLELFRRAHVKPE